MYSRQICSTSTTTTTTAAAAVITLMAIAVHTAWYTFDGRSPQSPPPVNSVLGHVSASACQLAAFAAVVYALSTRYGVRIVQASSSVCCEVGRQAAYQRLCSLHYYGSLSEPGGIAFESANGDIENERSFRLYRVPVNEHHRRHRKIKSATPLLQRYLIHVVSSSAVFFDIWQSFWSVNTDKAPSQISFWTPPHNLSNYKDNFFKLFLPITCQYLVLVRWTGITDIGIKRAIL